MAEYPFNTVDFMRVLISKLNMQREFKPRELKHQPSELVDCGLSKTGTQVENDSDRRDYTYSTNFGSKSASAVSAAYIARAFDSFLGDDISARDGAIVRL